MKTKILKLELREDKRLLFISDIHGNIDLFEKILQKVNYTKDDYLFIVGDMIEKSNENIKMLDYAIRLSKNKNVYILCGNCDNVILNLRGKVDDDLLRFYSLQRGKTIINEFAAGLGVKIDEDSNMQALCDKFSVKYKKYYDFVESLPHVIFINDKVVTCHGGINDLANISSSALDLMKYDDFYEKLEHPLAKPLIVGHYPTLNYQAKIPSLNPIIDLKKNVISIDGGNNVIPWSQLNCLIIDNLTDLHFSYEYVDSYFEVKVLEDVNVINDTLYNIRKTPKTIDIIKEYADFYYAKTSDNAYIYALKEEVFYDKKIDRMKVYNGFNYFIPLKKGDKVKLIFKRQPYSIVKKDGILGLVETKYLGG